MSISQAVQSRIDNLPPGQVFGYWDLPDYIEASLAIAQTMSRMVSAGWVKRLGLTTQVSRTVTVAVEGGRRGKGVMQRCVGVCRSDPIQSRAHRFAGRVPRSSNSCSKHKRSSK